MDRTDESLGGSGSVKATISIFAESKNVRKPEKNRSPFPDEQDVQFKERERANAEAELFRARGMAKELARQIEQANAQAKSHRSDAQAAMWKSGRKKKVTDESSQQKYTELSQELDEVKKQLCKLKSDVKSALDAKMKAERMFEAASSKTESNLLVLENIKAEIDEANEEHVLVELARIEAERERKEIDARRSEEAERFAGKMEDTRRKIKSLRREMIRRKELEAKLAATNSDVAVLRSEMEFVRAMEKNNNNVVIKTDAMEEEVDLRSAEEELKAAKDELARIKAEGFQFMSAMDETREEIARAAEEVKLLRERAKKADSQVQHLNSKLLKAKARMEAATVADERAQAIVGNLTAAQQHFQTEIEAAKREKEVTEEETACVRTETEKIRLDIRLTEDRIWNTVQDLDAVKASESACMNKLKSTVEETMKARSITLRSRRTVTLSKFEYEYLTQQASFAQALADKKVAAAEAWVEALKAGEKEMVMQSEAVETEIEEIRATEERKVSEIERLLAEEKRIEEELDGLQDETDEEDAGVQQHAVVAARRSVVREGGRSSVALKRVKVMRRVSVSSSSVVLNPRSPSFTVKKRTAIPNFVKLIRDRRARREN